MAGILLFVVLLQNTQVVSVRFLFWKVSMSRIILLPLVTLIGFIIGFFVGRKLKN
ncbi:MAG: LapA family protein [Candidatus Omnitrophota bacterium]